MAAVASNVRRFGFAFAVSAAIVAIGAGLAAAARMGAFLSFHVHLRLVGQRGRGFISQLLKSAWRSADHAMRRVGVVGLETILSGGITLMVYVLLVAGVYRIFQMGKEIGEIKEMLKSMRGGVRPDLGAAAAVVRPDSAEALVRAVHAASYQEIDDAIAESTESKQP
jgi:hypothetical protein